MHEERGHSFMFTVLLRARLFSISKGSSYFMTDVVKFFLQDEKIEFVESYKNAR